MALFVEAAELVEHFQWLKEEESTSVSNKKKLNGKKYHVERVQGISKKYMEYTT
jgi:DNA-dependent RNA polymerase auxiliary subunit epsilon